MKFKNDPHNICNLICIKKWNLSLFLFLFSLITYSQTPAGFNYQSVVRNASGNVISNSTVGVEFKLHQTTASGTVVYTETHTPTTNAYGVFNLVVGQGTTTDDFSSIDWASNSHFLEVSVDVTGGTTYVSMGTTQLLSVPYALHASSATTAENVSGLEAIEEGNGTGWRLIDANPDNYGDIGDNSIDLSVSTNTSTTNGAIGFNSLAIGGNASAQNSQDIAIGSYANASGNDATAIGPNSSASGFNSIAIGKLSNSSGVDSKAIGPNATAQGFGSFASGSISNAIGDHSVALGNLTIANGDNSYSLGRGTIADAHSSFVVGRYNVGGGTIDSWVDTDALLEVGNGTDSANKSNALTILKNGTVIAPSFDLAEITDSKALITKEYADANLTSDNLGNHTATENIQTAGFWITNDGDDEGISINADGKVGIGESNPQTSLDVVDTAVIGNISIGSQSTPQNASSNKDLGYLTTPWIYTNAIEAAGERGTGSTLITIGNDNNFGANDEIHFVTDGVSQVDISEGLLNVSGDVKATGNLDVANTAVIGDIAVGSQSTTQSTSNQKDEGYTKTPWLYTSAIQAPGELDSSPTLIAVGNNNNFGGNDEIHFVTNGSSQVEITDGLLNVSGGIKSTGDLEFNGALTTTSFENQIFGSYGDTSNLSNLGDRNVILGHQAAEGAESGDNNVVIGYFAGYNLNGDSNVLIGNAAGSGGSFSNQLHIRNLIYGEFDNKLLQIKGDLEVDETITSEGDIASGGEVIIDKDDDNLKAAGAVNAVEIISVIIDSDGSLVSNVTNSSGITTSRSGNTYKVDYSNHFGSYPSVTITCLAPSAGALRVAQITTLGQSYVEYTVDNHSGDYKTDARACITIIGKRK